MSGEKKLPDAADSVALSVDMTDDNGCTVLDNSQYIEQHHEEEARLDIPSYTVLKVNANSEENPYRESTNTVPYLIRRVNSVDITPRPFKTFNQVLAVTYLSILCCLFPGVCANHWAWEAKTERGQGLFSMARRSARTAVILAYVSFVLGAVIAIVVTTVLLTWKWE